jgi:hypothetical protein
MAWINWGSESQEQKDARRRFEEEQALYEQAVRFSQAQAAAAAAGSGGLKKDPTSNNYVENRYVENYFK